MALECLLLLWNIIVAWVNWVRFNRNGQVLNAKLRKAASKDAASPLRTSDESESIEPSISAAPHSESIEEGSEMDVGAGRDDNMMGVPSSKPDGVSRPICFDATTFNAETASKLNAERLTPGFSVSPSCKSIDDRPTTSKLGEKLLEAQIYLQGSFDSFIPNNKWQRLITLDAISTELSRDPERRTKVNLEQYARKILETAPRLFAALVCCGHSHFIDGFINESIDDSDIPFVRGDAAGPIEFCSKKTRRPVNCMRSWGNRVATDFARLQGSLCSPVFNFGDEIEHKELNDNDVLPFVENHQRNKPAQGGFGSVWKAKIHDAHQTRHGRSDTEERYPFVAIKELHHDDEDCFVAEVEMLKMFKKQKHAHLVELLATYRYKGRYYLLFPWADSTLRRYWQSNPKPDFSYDTILWFLRQCKAIGSGLHMMHEYRSTEESMNSPSSPPPEPTEGYKNRPEDDMKRYGRHGDIKPENILWFLDGNLDSPNEGILVIADFGLSDIHRRDTRSHIRVATGSATYEPPEVMTSKLVSREYDIWSLGCTFLEFATWLVCGWNVLNQFPEARALFDGRHVKDDVFYTIVDNQPGESTTAVVRRSVVEWMQDMRALPRCSPFILDFLDMISEQMLVVNPKDRIKAGALNSKLQCMLEQAERNSAYLVGPPLKQMHQQSDSDDGASYSLRNSRIPILSRHEGDPLPKRDGMTGPRQRMRACSPELPLRFFTALPT